MQQSSLRKKRKPPAKFFQRQKKRQKRKPQMQKRIHPLFWKRQKQFPSSLFQKQKRKKSITAIWLSRLRPRPKRLRADWHPFIKTSLIGFRIWLITMKQNRMKSLRRLLKRQIRNLKPFPPRLPICSSR